MRKLILIILFFSGAYKLSAEPSGIDSLKQQLQLVTNDSLKAPLYSQIAAQYIQFDTTSNRRLRYIYQTNAISYTLAALHLYSRYNDTLGLRLSFDNLAKVYLSQKKYPQAKWFILQSINLSREKNDLPYIINSLMDLASLKIDIKDYRLAMRDLNEALTLSSKNHFPKQESTVMQHFAILYSNMHNYAKEAAALKRANAIDDSIKKAEEMQLAATISTQDSVIVKKKASSVSVSKRAYKVSYTTYKSKSSRKIATL